jgi:pyridoxal phosphate enzyme (YggS family)
LSPADIQVNLDSLNLRIAAACRRVGRSPSEVTLIAVSKTVEPPEMLIAYHCGIRHFGENRVQEGQRKWPLLGCLEPAPVRHLIGHLQSNKIKPALELFDVIHSLDSVELAEAINRRSTRRFPVLLEVNIGEEATKSGFAPQAIFPAFEIISRLPNLEIRGLMTVAPISAQTEAMRPVFGQLRELRDRLGLKELSMGMTDDFEIAIEEGATLIRVGRAIFGERRKKPIDLH